MATARHILFPFILALCIGSLLPLCAMAAEDEDTDSVWHLNAGVGAYVVDLPEYAPLWDFKTVPAIAGNRVNLSDDAVVAPLLQVSLERELDDQWFVQAKTEYARIQNQVDSSYSHSAGMSYIGYFSLSGQYTLSGTAGTAYTSTDITFQEYGLNLLAGKTFALDEAEIRVFGGYWFTLMDVDYGLDYRTSTSPNRMTQNESLRTYYNGLLAGVAVSRRHGDWNVELETTQGVGLGHTSYHGTQENSTGSYVDERRLNRDQITWRGTFSATVSTQLTPDWDLALTGEARFLSYVPQILASGTSAASNLSLTGSPTNLKNASSFSGRFGLELSYSF